MAKRMITLMAALLVLGFVVAGCGDDDSSSDNGDTAAQTVTDTVTDDEVVTDTETVTDETEAETVPDVTSDDSGGAVAPENLEQAIEQCRKNVNAAPQLSEDTKNDLEEICEKAGSGDQEDVREAAAEVCRKVVADTLPAGAPGRDQALEACDRNTQR